LGLLKIVIRAKAKTDLRNILEYGIAEHGRERAEHYLRELNETITLAQEHPRIGPVTENISPTLRSLRHKLHRIYYTADDQKLTVVRVLHQSMDVVSQIG
jgi:toxin ParE1/3/4